MSFYKVISPPSPLFLLWGVSRMLKTRKSGFLWFSLKLSSAFFFLQQGAGLYFPLANHHPFPYIPAHLAFF